MGSVSQSGKVRKYEERPPPCRVCEAPSWWDGIRRVKQVVRDALGAIFHRCDEERRRARCSDRACAARRWTVYPAGSYPYRRYQLPVVASAVGDVAFGNATFDTAAATHTCDRRSVGRWVYWVANLVSPAEVARTCARMDATGLSSAMPVTRGTTLRERAGSVLRWLLQLAQVLVAAGVPLPEASDGLSRVLGGQLARFGVGATLSESSPPTHVFCGLPTL